MPSIAVYMAVYHFLTLIELRNPNSVNIKSKAFARFSTVCDNYVCVCCTHVYVVRVYEGVHFDVT